MRISRPLLALLPIVVAVVPPPSARAADATDTPVTEMPLGEVSGSRLVTDDHELVGPIERVVADEFGNRFAVLGIETQLGLDRKEVVIPLADLAWDEDIAAFVTSATQAELDDLPPLDESYTSPDHLPPEG